MPSLRTLASRENDAFDKRVASIPHHTLALSAFAAGVAATLGTRAIYLRFFKRIPNGDWITPDMFSKGKWLKGRVVSVGDADNFRIYHTPGFGWRWPLKLRSVPSTSKELKDQTIHIRMAGVDAPEGAHFGRTEQPYYKESISWLKNEIEGRTVYCQVAQRDQYHRIVAMPYLAPRLLPGFLTTGDCLSLKMISAGWGVVYKQSGAVYGHWGEETFDRLEKEAQRAKRGMWRKGTSGESPSEYKKRHVAGVSEGLAEPAPAPAPKPRKKTLPLLSALWQRFSRR